MTPVFDDSGWQSGVGGFGTAGTPGAVIGTTWNTDDIWLRRSFDLTSDDLTWPITLRMHHDDNVEAYLNGVPIEKLPGFLTGYADFALDQTALAALHPGKNILAVHCHQVAGGQYIDAGVEVETPPWWQVDLGKILSVDHTEIYFNYPTEITPYKLLFNRRNQLAPLCRSHHGHCLRSAQGGPESR
jgi:hypothetical protein